MADNPTYLDRRKARVAALRLKHQIVFGYGVGTALLFLGFIKCYLVIEAWHSFWYSLMWAGALALLLTLTLPSLWSLPEQGFRWLTGRIGHGAFLFCLSLFYYLLICPAGWWLRQRQGCAPIWEWVDRSPAGERWQEKTSLTTTHHRTSDRRRLLLLQPFAVIGFFIKRRNYVLVPIVVILIILGLILFFVQTSALAPFIYTLF